MRIADEQSKAGRLAAYERECVIHSAGNACNACNKGSEQSSTVVVFEVGAVDLTVNHSKVWLADPSNDLGIEEWSASPWA